MAIYAKAVAYTLGPQALSGGVRQTFTLCGPEFNVIDGDGKVVYILSGQYPRLSISRLSQKSVRPTRFWLQEHIGDRLHNRLLQ